MLETLTNAVHGFSDTMSVGFNTILQFFAAHSLLSGILTLLFSGVCRFLLPLLALLVVVRCARSLFQSKWEPECWGHLTLSNGERLPLNHWENLVGRARFADVQLLYPSVSRTHAALIRDSKGSWMLHPLNSKNGVTLNNQPVTTAIPLQPRDIIAFGGISTCFLPATKEEERQQADKRLRPGKVFSPSITLLLLTLFQLLLSIEILAAVPAEHQKSILFSFGLLIAVMWGLYLLYRIFRRTGYELETLAFFLTTLCLTITACTAPGSIKKQTFCVIVGIVLFFSMTLFLRYPEFVRKARWPMAAGSMLLLGINLLLAAVHFGARNWLSIGGISFQPSEFVKIVFILVGAVTLDKMFERKNLIITLLYSAFCVGCLGLMSDFGTALIFFVTFLAITFLRSGDLASVAFMLASAVFAGYIVLQFKSYIFARFAVYRHVWEDPSNLGYQQTRTLSAIANGGLFGKGVGNGWLHNVGASNTDLVFGVISEEMGLLIALLTVAVILIMSVFAVREASAARSSFNVITACSVAMIFVVQTMLNVFGSTDLLPLTGVTLPFVSVGGSSMMSCWTLLAFIKASDTRQNAALAVRLPQKKKKDSAEEEPEAWQERTGFLYRPHDLKNGDDSEPTRLHMKLTETQPIPAPVPAPAPEPEPEAPADFPDVNITAAALASDADNWKDYFLKAEEWDNKTAPADPKAEEWEEK